MYKKNDLIFTNTISGEIISKSIPTGKEVFFQGGNMITETDINGVIIYANRKFIDLTGFTKEEVIGSPHYINRHPDMPKGAFRSLWKTVYSGKIWKGIVKNLTKDGSFYWVRVYVKPKFDNEKIVGFIATRQIATDLEIKEASAVYKKYNADSEIDSEIYKCNYDEELKLGSIPPKRP